MDAQNKVSNGKDKANAYKRGKGIYTRHLAVPESYKGKKRVFVRFEAAGQTAAVFLNDKLVGEHLGAFTAFCIELTHDINYGGDNLLRVEVDNRWRADLAPLSGGFAIMGGLYRPAELIVTDLLCINPLYYGSQGVFVDTKNNGEVNIRTHLHLGKYTDGRMTTTIPHTQANVEVSIYDADNHMVAHHVQTATCRSGNDEVVVSPLPIDHPQLWLGKQRP